MRNRNHPPIEGGAEIWRAIVTPKFDYTGLYEVSDRGRVRGLIRGKVMKPDASSRYLRVPLTVNRKYCKYTIHSLVCYAFIGYPPDGYEIHHKYGKLDNRARSIGILTKRENLAIEKTIKSGLPTGVSLTPNNEDGRLENKYVVGITLKMRKISLGRYRGINEAAKAYQIACKMIHKNKDVTRMSITESINKYRISIGYKPTVVFKKAIF